MKKNLLIILIGFILIAMGYFIGKVSVLETSRGMELWLGIICLGFTMGGMSAVAHGIIGLFSNEEREDGSN